MMDPWTKSEEQAIELLEDMVTLLLLEEMRQHYK